MSEAIKEAMNGLQAEYRKVAMQLGNARAYNLKFQREVNDLESQLLVIIKKIENLDNQMPKKEPKGGDTNGQSSNSTDAGSDTGEPKQNSN